MVSTGWRGPRLQIPGFCTQGGRDRRRWDAGGDSRDAEAVLEALRTCLGLLDADVGHGPGDLPMGGRPRSGLEGFAGGLRRRRAERMDELEGAEQLGRDVDLALVLGAALQGPDRGGLEVDVHRPDGQGLETRATALRMIKRRARQAGLPTEICAHSFRGTGITEYLRNGGDLEVAARIAGHESTRTTQLYNRVQDEISLDEIERIHI